MEKKIDAIKVEWKGAGEYWLADVQGRGLTLGLCKTEAELVEAVNEAVEQGADKDWSGFATSIVWLSGWTIYCTEAVDQAVIGTYTEIADARTAVAELLASGASETDIYAEYDGENYRQARYHLLLPEQVTA